MGIIVNLKVSSSPVEKIGKTLTQGNDYTCLLKDDCSILRPMIDIQSSDNLSGYNYMYIGDFGRYYFIDDITSLHNGLWRISGHVDVLETYKQAILANQAVIKRQAKQFNLYLDDPEFKTYACEQIMTKKFPANSFSKSLHYILTVNGS